MAARRFVRALAFAVGALVVWPGFAAPACAQVTITIGDGAVLAGTVAEVSVEMDLVGGVGAEPVQVAGIELDLSWDPAVLFLEGFDPVGPLESWLRVENLGRARARIALASVDGFLLEGTAVQVATLRFRTSPAPGASAVILEAIPIRTAALEPVPAIPVSGFIQAIGAVSSVSCSIGELKIMFHDRE